MPFRLMFLAGKCCIFLFLRLAKLVSHSVDRPTLCLVSLPAVAARHFSTV
jgi:hypothetical protein